MKGVMRSDKTEAVFPFKNNEKVSRPTGTLRRAHCRRVKMAWFSRVEA